MSDINEITGLIREQSAAIEGHAKRTEARFSQLEADIRETEKKAGRPMLGGSADAADAPTASGWVNAKTAEPILVLKHGQALAAKARNGDTTPSIGRVLRGLCLGGTAPDAAELEAERKSLNMGSDPAGGYTVTGALADQWIDALRANMVLSKAGAVTLPMDAGKVSIARVTADPTCSWHGEGSALPATEPTFGALSLNAKTVVCLVKFSVELGQDAVNLEQQLQSVIVNAMANAIDAAGLNGVTTDAGVAPGGIMNLAGRNSVTGIGAPASYDFLIDGVAELLVDNVAMDNIGALIAHPLVWKKLAKLRTGITNDETPLQAPVEIARIPKLWTTAAPLVGGTTASGIIGNWNDLVFGVRQQITVKVLQESFMGSNLQLAVLAYARVDFGAARPQSFCTLEGITV